MLKSLALGALLSLAAVAAQAAPVTAQLQSPLAKGDTFVAGETAWVCQGDSCVAGDAHNDTWSVDTCRQLAKQVGGVAGFSGAKGSFDEAKLAKCNAGLPGSQAAQATKPAPAATNR